MKGARLESVLCAGAVLCTAAAALPVTVSAEPVELFLDDFEDGDSDGWASHGGAATVSVTTDQAHTGKSSFYITDREQNWHGGECSKVGYFYAGQSYSCSLWFYYDEETANDSQNFQLGYKYVLNGETRYGSVGSVTAKKGEWSEMKANVTFPEGITGITLYTQCDDGHLPYYIDDCSASGEPYEGEEQDGFSYDFEDGKVADWYARSCNIEVTDKLAHSGTYSLHTSNRSELWNSPAVDSTLFLKKGGYYSFSCWVAYDGADWTETAAFQIYLMYNLDGVTQYQNLADESTAKGEWVQIATRYTIPENATNLAFYVQPKWSSNPSEQDLKIDFYIDDVVCEHMPDPEIQKDIPNLYEAYEDQFRIGCAATASELTPKAAQEMALKHYNSLTFGNELKPESVLNQAACKATGSQTGVAVSLAQAKPLLEFAKENNLAVRGHCLVWHSQTPDWFFHDGYDENQPWSSRETMLARMENYIKAVFEAIQKDYPTVNFYCWDVVNEAFMDDGSYRPAGSIQDDSANSPWIKTIGEDYITYAFTYARQYAPKGCKLFYNDYNEYTPAKREAILKVVNGLAEKKLIDGIGMQSHLQMSSPTISGYEETIKAYAETGLEVQITELDINLKDNSRSAQLELAERYRQVMETIVKCKKNGANITAVVFWGITDATSWIGGYPLLFDEDYQAKPSFYAVLDPTQQIQTVRNKDAIRIDTAQKGASTAEECYADQNLESLGGGSWWKAVWDESGLTVNLYSQAAGTAQILFNGEITKHPVVKGDNEIKFSLPDTKLGTAYSFDILLNEETWNSMDGKLSEENAGTVTLGAVNAFAEAAAGTVEIDAVIDDAWADAPEIAIDNFQMGKAGTNAQGTAKLLWDADNLYVLVQVKDPNGMHSSSTNHYECDTVEVFVDANNRKTTAYESDDIQCRIGYDNSKTVSDNHSISDFVSSAKQNADGYLVEIAVPCGISGYSSGSTIGFDIQINDDDGSGERAGIANWSGDKTGMGYATTKVFGIVRLTGEDGPLYGDVDCNGDVNVVDAVLLARLVADDATLKDTDITADGKTNADVTHDGKPDKNDLTKLLDYLAGRIERRALALADE